MKPMKKLPKGLPPLPPVPDGYDRWKYVGVGPLKKEIEVGAYLVEFRGYKNWESPGMCAGDAAYHYVEAVRDPKPAPKKRKAKRVVAIVRYADLQDWPNPPEDRGIACHPKCALNNEPPVFILPADAASVEQAVRQVAKALDWEDGTGAGHENNAAKALLAIGYGHPDVSKKFGIRSK